MPTSIASPPTSALVRAAAAAFGTTRDALAADRARWPAAHIAPPAVGSVLLFAGPSGGGKSTALRDHLARSRRAGWHVTDVDRVRLSPLACVDQFGRTGDLEHDLAFAAGRLAQVGLGEARVLLSPPSSLSDGERWRLRLAVAVTRIMARRGKRGGVPGELLVADEFAAILDRVTACVVARSLRKTIDRLSRVGVPLAAAVATSHDDLRPALLPDRVVWCDG